MATDFTIQDHHVLQFTKNVELLLQQKQSKLIGAVGTGSYVGDAAQVVTQFGEVEFQDNTNWKGDTTWSDLDHEQRWVFPSDKDLALAVAKEDQLRMIIDPRSPYAEAMRAAYNRTVDRLIVAAAFGSAKIGKYDDMRNRTFPAGQVIASGGIGLTLDKLLGAREMLSAAQVDPSDTRYFVCSEKQITDLLKDEKVTSSDYATVKALVKGEIDSYVGFTFITYEELGVENTNERACIAYVKSGLHFGTWNGLEVHMDQRPDKKYVWQIYGKCTLGATRTQEKKVVEVRCTEA